METNYASPFQIGNVTIPNRVVFAPMAGVSDLPFRLLCHEMGAGLVCMEMISAKAITFRSHRTAEFWDTSPEEKPVSLQIFGHEPDVMEEACRILEEQDFDILDINMGCPVPKIVNNQEGSALMKDPALIEKAGLTQYMAAEEDRDRMIAALPPASLPPRRDGDRGPRREGGDRFGSRRDRR